MEIRVRHVKVNIRYIEKGNVIHIMYEIDKFG